MTIGEDMLATLRSQETESAACEPHRTESCALCETDVDALRAEVLADPVARAAYYEREGERLREENARLRHALQVAHDWMGRSPDNDCDEGGGFGAAHLATAERTVIAALNGDCEGKR